MSQLLAPAMVKRRLPSVPYQATVRNSINIDRDGVLSMIVLRLAFRVTNGGTAAVGPLWQALARIIRRLEIVVNGQDTPISISGAHLASRAQVEWGSRAFGMDTAIVLTASAATDYEVVLPLPMFLPRAVRPDDTSLDLRRVDQAILAITWGDATDIYTTPNAAAVSNVVCNVEGHYLVNARPDQVFLTRSLDMQDTPNQSSNANLAILQDRGSDMFWRSFHIATLRNSAAATNILTGDVRLSAGAFTYAMRDANAILAETMRESAIPVAEFPAADRAYRLALPYLGQNTTLINAAALSGDLFLTLGTTYTSGTEQISISREAMRPLRV
jgi:hypothetical protein